VAHDRNRKYFEKKLKKVDNLFFLGVLSNENLDYRMKINGERWQLRTLAVNISEVYA